MTLTDTGTTLREHQMVMLDLLRQTDAICRKHNIPYLLFAGTMLGAVRHRGFIPWDDDLDLLFLRPDYERFLAAAEAELDPADYCVQREFTEHWPMQSSKLRKNGTACLEKFHPKDPDMHRGIYIDIFPCDALSDNALLARLQFLASKVVISKALDGRGYETDSKMKKLALRLSRLLPLRPFLRLVQLGGRQDTQRVHSFLGGSSRLEKSVYPRAWVRELRRIPFEDGEYPVSEHYDAFLTTLYGDYMTLPPESERSVKAHAFLVDARRSYLDYAGADAGMVFETLTRSIR